MKLINYALALSLFYLISACNTTSTPENPCEAFDDLEVQLLDRIEQIKSKHSGDREFLRKLDNEQVYWIQYRNRRLRAMYPEDWDRIYRKQFGKETFNSCKCLEMLRMSENRMEDLAYYLDGAPNGQEDCPSVQNSAD